MSKIDDKDQIPFNLLDIISQIWTQRQVIALISCIGGALGLAFVTLSPAKVTGQVDIYEIPSSDLFKVRLNYAQIAASSNDRSPIANGLDAALTDAISTVATVDAFFEQFRIIFRRGDLLEQTITEYSEAYQAFDGSQSEKNALLKSIAAQFSLRDKASGTLELTFRATNVEEGRAIASALTSQINAEINSRTRQTLDIAIRDLREKLNQELSLLDIEIETLQQLERQALQDRIQFITAQIDAAKRLGKYNELSGITTLLPQTKFLSHDSVQQLSAPLGIQSFISLEAELSLLKRQFEKDEVSRSPQIGKLLVHQKRLRQQLNYLVWATTFEDTTFLKAGFDPTLVDLRNAKFTPTRSDAVTVVASVFLSFLLSILVALLRMDLSRETSPRTVG